MFFGRAANQLASYEATKTQLLTEEELLDHARTLTSVVWPSARKATETYNGKVRANHDLTHKTSPTYKEGQSVMMWNLNQKRKGDPLWVGPYLVHQVHGQGAYTLKDATGDLHPSRIPHKHLKACALKPDPSHREVRKILAHKDEGKQRLYLVEWEEDGLSPEWVRSEDFGSLEIIRAYHAVPPQVRSGAGKRGLRKNPKREQLNTHLSN